MNCKHPCHERSKRRVRRGVRYGDCDSETRQFAYHNEDVVELGVERPGRRLVIHVDRVKRMRRLSE
eukprot:1458768-Pleurochrysis_carterae.AAC.1